MIVNNPEIYSYPFDPIDSRMYVMINGRYSLIIDPVVSDHALKNLRDHEVTEGLILLTHEHYDHISGVNWLKSNISCKVICSKKCAENIPAPEKNLSKHFETLFIMEPAEVREQVRKLQVGPYSCHADYTFEKEAELDWHGMKVTLKETPGHSEGSICILSDKGIMFTGDTIVDGARTITKLPGGSRKQLEFITKPWIESLPDSLMVFPGHGERGILKDLINNMEKR